MQEITRINLSNVQTCNQVWDEMPLTDKGRLCQQCNNELIDFRKMNQKQIAEQHVYTEGKVCGIYRKAQLRYPSQANVPQCTKYKAMFIAIAGLLSSGEMDAQDHRIPIRTEQISQEHIARMIPVNTDIPAVADSLPLYFVKGTVKDTIGENMIGSSVHVKGTRCGTVTNMDGEYLLDLSPVISNQDSIELVYSYIGYTRELRTISLASFSNKDTLQMDTLLLDVEMMEDNSIVSFGVIRHPWYKRFWYRITRPFR